MNTDSPDLPGPVTDAATRPLSGPASRHNLRKDARTLFLLLAVIILSGLAVAYQVFLYRESFVSLQGERRQREKLDEEWGKLLIEQQTFGAITQVGSSAVLRLQMYSPRSTEVVTLADRPLTVKPENHPEAAGEAGHD